MLTITCNVQCMVRAPLGRFKQVVDSYKAIKQEPLVQFASTNMPFDEFFDKSKTLLWIKNYPIIKTSNALSCHINSLEELIPKLRFIKEADFKDDSYYLGETDKLIQDINQTQTTLTEKKRLLEKNPDFYKEYKRKEIVSRVIFLAGGTLTLAFIPVVPLLYAAWAATKPGKD